MAQTQRYFENNKQKHYKEGPYVLCGPFPDGTYRIEKYNPNSVCSVVPIDDEKYQQQLEKKGFRRGTYEELSSLVDELNKGEQIPLILEEN